jgi:large subunit ribosomal protein L6
MVIMSTSRVGKKPIIIPSGVEVNLNGHDLTIKGPKGKMNFPIHPFVHLGIADGQIQVGINENDDSDSEEGGSTGTSLGIKKSNYCRSGSGTKLKKSIPGTTRAKIANIIHGVTQGFERKLLLVGVGYRAQMKGQFLALSLGFSHPVEFPVPEGITIEAPTLTEIIVKGPDKDLVGLVASKIRAYRSPEPYKGKGVRYANENVVRKETKKK